MWTKRTSKGIVGDGKTVSDPDDTLLEVDRDTVKNILWKVDRQIVPVVFLLYLFSFLDRANIGNARLFGMEEDLDLTGDEFQIATSVFFATYAPTQAISTAPFKKLQPARFLGGCAMAWGIIASLTGLTQNYGGLLACRLLLGVMEGPLIPCLVLYLTFFYTRRELAVRFGCLVSGAALSGAVGGLIAYGIGHMDGAQGLRAWRWLFIIEGIPSFVLGLYCVFFLANSPESAWYLTPSERKTLLSRGKDDRREAMTPSAQRLGRPDIKAAFKDWKVWVFAAQNFGADIQLFSYAIFLPTIIRSISSQWSDVTVQALTIPCYVWSCAMYFVSAYISDRTQHRASWGVIGSVVAIIGNAMLIAGQTVTVQYAGCFMIATGLFIVSGIGLVWLAQNCPRYGKRAVAVGIQLAIGDSAGAASPYLYPTNDKPRYKKGHGITIAMLVLSAALNIVLWWAYRNINDRRKRGEEDWKMEGKTEEEIDEMGDDSPRFVYNT